jgi:hypothetical protein
VSLNRVPSSLRSSVALRLALGLSAGCSTAESVGAVTAGDATPDSRAEETNQSITDTLETDAAADTLSPDTEVAGPPLAAGCRDPGTAAATAGCLVPTFPPEYYVAEALAYFDTLDIDADPTNIPKYAEQVARWEWPPWLLLTGLGRDVMVDTAALLREFDPSTVPVRDCRFFPVQPFARCYVSFNYEGGDCPIYEEFVFNDAGETTFIEAWSSIDGLSPTSEADPWAEDPGFPRLSTRVPGLGTPDAVLDVESEAMAKAAATDADLADFVERARDFWGTWLAEYQGADKSFFAKGCGW